LKRTAIMKTNIKISIIILCLLVLFTLLGCGTAAVPDVPDGVYVSPVEWLEDMELPPIKEITDYDSIKSLSAIYQLFEEKNSRNFKIHYPMTINKRPYYLLVATGILNNGEEYIIGICAFNQKDPVAEYSGYDMFYDYGCYYYDVKTNEYVKFAYSYYVSPQSVFSCATSPDGKWRAERIGIGTVEQRIIDLETGRVLWTNQKDYTINTFIWSEDSRFVAMHKANNGGNAVPIVIDTNDFSEIIMPGSDEIKLCDENIPYRGNLENIHFRILEWKNESSIIIEFKYYTVKGMYMYDILNDKLEIISINTN